MTSLAECYEKIRDGSCTEEEIEAFSRAVRDSLGECAMLVQSLASFASTILSDSKYIRGLAGFGSQYDLTSPSEMSAIVSSVIADIESKASNYLEAMALAAIATARMIVIYDGKVRKSFSESGISDKIPLLAEIGMLEN